MNLFWYSLDSAYSIGLFEQCILYQNINLRWSTRKDIGSVLQKNWRGLILSLSPTARKDSSKAVTPSNINFMQAVVG